MRLQLLGTFHNLAVKWVLFMFLDCDNDCLIPVSYTHLDVYKRQEQTPFVRLQKRFLLLRESHKCALY